jgi:hypothetical protein
MEPRPYTDLINKLQMHFTKLQDAEMVAILIAAKYQNETLIKIVNSRLYKQLPAVASEALTTVDDIAQKVLLNVSLDNESENNDVQ